MSNFDWHFVLNSDSTSYALCAITASFCETSPVFNTPFDWRELGASLRGGLGCRCPTNPLLPDDVAEIDTDGNRTG